jgi:hypothetical protein
MLEQNTKFFKMVEFDGTDNEHYSLFVCHKDTPIPTAKEIVKRKVLSPFCKDDKVIEITMAEFLTLQTNLLASLADSAEDMMEWAPNFTNGLCTWEFWENEEDL